MSASTTSDYPQIDSRESLGSIFANKQLPLLLALVFVVTFIAITFTHIAPQAGATPTQSQASEQQAENHRVHTVQRGESYWSIATDLAPGKDPRPVVNQLIEMNGNALQIGQEILLPVR